MTLIDPQYQEQIRLMHSRGKFDNGAKQLALVRPFLEQHRPRTLLDFGCGKGALIREIEATWPDTTCQGYDPGNPAFDRVPTGPFDAVISTDAIEHIEPDHLSETLTLIGQLIGRVGCFRIACHPAKKLLPDGRNCHLIVQEPDWWREQVLSAMPVRITWERVEPFDRRDKNPILFGSKYDLWVEKT